MTYDAYFWCEHRCGSAFDNSREGTGSVQGAAKGRRILRNTKIEKRKMRGNHRDIFGLLKPVQLLDHTFDLAVPSDDFPAAFPPMGVETAGTVFAPVRTDHKVSPTPGPQQIEGAPAEQTVEILRVRSRVAGKVFTFPMGEIRAFFVCNQISQSLSAA